MTMVSHANLRISFPRAQLQACVGVKNALTALEVLPLRPEPGRLPGAGLGQEAGSLALQISCWETPASSALQQLSLGELDVITTLQRRKPELLGGRKSQGFGGGGQEMLGSSQAKPWLLWTCHSREIRERALV